MTNTSVLIQGGALAVMGVFVIFTPALAGWLNLSFLRFSRRYRAIFGYGAVIAGLGFVAIWAVRNLGLLHSD
jgi:hypothetical protein